MIIGVPRSRLVLGFVTGAMLLLAGARSEAQLAVSAAGVSIGNGHGLALDTDGLVYSWGYNASGQLGNGTFSNGLTPARILGLPLIQKVAAGFRHSLALAADGTVWTWGENSNSQLGHGTPCTPTTCGIPSPGHVPGLTQVVDIEGGWYVSAALLSDGTVWTWGNQWLGNGSSGSSIVPQQVMGLSNIVALASDSTHMLALRNDGTVWAWGANADGQLGDGTTTPRLSPVQVSGITNAIGIAAGQRHSLFLLSDSTVWACGWNGYGQLGDGTTTPSAVPVLAAGLIGARAIAASGAHSLAVLFDGTVQAWGYNGSGQLGVAISPNTCVTNISWPCAQVPTPVPGLTRIDAVSAGASSSFALRLDGSLWAWGSGSLGALGTGTTSGSPVPVPTATFVPLTVQVTQPAGPGGGVLLTNSGLVVFNEYFNVISGDLCPNGPGTGPYLGLCANDPQFLISQVLLPINTFPFHFNGPGPNISFGPFLLPPLTVEIVSFGVIPGRIFPISDVIRATVQ